MTGITVGKPLAEKPSDLTSLVDIVLSEQLRAKKVNHQDDGDTRYWGVEPAQHQVLSRLKEFSDRCYREQVGQPPGLSVIMVNVIDAVKSPTGSGGGWHRDSFKSQYKAFAYLTDVKRETQGAFAFIPKSNAAPIKLYSLMHRVLTGGNRYGDGFVQTLQSFGLGRTPVLLDAGVPFFADTSLIHRGLRISEGKRIMATVYMFDGIPNDFKHLA